jgi:MSHA biogenesis protein MshM
MLAYGQGHYKMTMKLLKAAVNDTESIEQDSKASLLVVSCLLGLGILWLAYYTLAVKL